MSWQSWQYRYTVYRCLVSTPLARCSLPQINCVSWMCCRLSSHWQQPFFVTIYDTVLCSTYDGGGSPRTLPYIYSDSALVPLWTGKPKVVHCLWLLCFIWWENNNKIVNGGCDLFFSDGLQNRFMSNRVDEYPPEMLLCFLLLVVEQWRN